MKIVCLKSIILFDLFLICVLFLFMIKYKLRITRNKIVNLSYKT